MRHASLVLLPLFLALAPARGADVPAPAAPPADQVVFICKDQKGAPVGDAVIALIPLPPTPVPAAPATLTPATVAQKGGEFRPYVTAIRVGTRVEFPNQDEVQHQVYSLSAAKRFEIPLYGGSTTHSEVFDQPGIVSLGCNIHDWMVAYVIVLDTPWFATGGPDGHAVLTAPPPGHYRCEVWHPRLGQPGFMVAEENLVIAAGADARREFTLTLRPDRRIRRSLEAPAAGYR